MNTAISSSTRVYDGEHPLVNDAVQRMSQTWTTNERLTVLNLAANNIGVVWASALERALQASFYRAC